jgi:hypothetical protein
MNVVMIVQLKVIMVMDQTLPLLIPFAHVHHILLHLTLLMHTHHYPSLLPHHDALHILIPTPIPIAIDGTVLMSLTVAALQGGHVNITAGEWLWKQKQKNVKLSVTRCVGHRDHMI